MIYARAFTRFSFYLWSMWGCCLWRVTAAFIVNGRLPFTHLHITRLMPRKPIIFGVCGNRRTSECKRNLFVLPSAKEEKPWLNLQTERLSAYGPN